MALGATVLLATGLTACVPSQPSRADWRASARQALDDTTSEVESVALVLDLESRDRLPGRSARVAAVESEESLASAEQTFTSQQPPPGTGRQDAEVQDVLGRATDLLREARVAVTAGDEASYDALRARLGELSDDLDRVGEDLR
ncbi:hypothetical protein ASG76_06775 [Nocardioides sp. Soil774]|nr:hypothetical protein ASG76_06775 [Nocardioides sp. Soil774]